MDQLIERYAKVPAKHRYLAFAGVLCAMGGAFYYLVFQEAADRKMELEARYKQLEGERAAKQSYVDNQEKYEARLSEVQQELNAARAQLPDDADVPQLLAQLGNKARQARLSIDRFEPRSESVKDFYAEVGFQMKVRGSFHEIGTFIDSVGRLDRIINVADIKMVNPKTVSQKIIVESEFFVKTYRFVAESEGKKRKKKKKKG